MALFTTWQVRERSENWLLLSFLALLNRRGYALLNFCVVRLRRCRRRRSRRRRSRRSRRKLWLQTLSPLTFMDRLASNST